MGVSCRCLSLGWSVLLGIGWHGGMVGQWGIVVMRKWRDSSMIVVAKRESECHIVFMVGFGHYSYALCSSLQQQDSQCISFSNCTRFWLPSNKSWTKSLESLSSSSGPSMETVRYHRKKNNHGALAETEIEMAQESQVCLYWRSYNSIILTFRIGNRVWSFAIVVWIHESTPKQAL
jgi:hypothetical protein